MYSLSFINNLKSSSKSDSIVLLEAILTPSEKKTDQNLYLAVLCKKDFNLISNFSDVMN